MRAIIKRLTESLSTVVDDSIFERGGGIIVYLISQDQQLTWSSSIKEWLRVKELSIKQKHLSYKLGAILISSILFFSAIFWLAGNFEGHAVINNNKSADVYGLLYFSVVSITTLGYGDFTPTGISRLFASLEAVFGILFIGYSISQVLSLRQSTLVEYSVSYSIHEAYNKCIEYLIDAKESIGDKRREIQNGITPEKISFIYNRSNPFYPSIKALRITNGYSSHLVNIGKIDELVKHVERAAHHVEELAGFSRKYLNLLQHKNIDWKQDRTVLILLSLCDQIDYFLDQFIERTSYASKPYKGGGMYKDVVKSIANDIREKCKKA